MSIHHNLAHHKLAAGLGAIALSLLLFAIGYAPDASAATAPGLGAAASYAVIAGSTVTNTGPSTISGDLGVSPGTAVTGFPPGLVSNGSIHSADANAGQAQSAVTTAYNVLDATPCDFDLTGQDLGGQTLTEGVYCFSTSAQLTGALTLNAQGNASAVFIFEIGSTLTTASNALVQVINGGVDCNVFWQVGSSATLGTDTVFVGNILALTSITLNTTASVSGRALARDGAVTLDSNHVSFDACALSTATPSPTEAPTVTQTAAPTPTPVGETPAPTPVGQTPSPTPTPTSIGQTPSPIPTPTPVGQTPSPIPTPTPIGQTPSPIPTPTPIGQTPSPTPTPTPAVPTPSPTLVIRTPTATPHAALPPPPAPTNTPSPTPGTHFPNTGGPPSQSGLPWLTLLLGLTLSTIGATAFVMNRRSQQVVASKEVR